MQTRFLHLLLEASWDSTFLALFIFTAWLQCKQSCACQHQLQEQQHEKRERSTQLLPENHPNTGGLIGGREN